MRLFKETSCWYETKNKNLTIHNISHKNIWHTWAVKLHVDPPPIILIKRKLDLKMERDYMKIKLCRNTVSEKLDMYAFKMALFDNVDPE